MLLAEFNSTGRHEVPISWWSSGGNASRLLEATLTPGPSAFKPSNARSRASQASPTLFCCFSPSPTGKHPVLLRAGEIWLGMAANLGEPAISESFTDSMYG